MGCHLLTDIIKIYLSKGKILYRLLFKTKLSKGGLVEYTGANPRHETPQGQLVVWNILKIPQLGMFLFFFFFLL